MESHNQEVKKTRRKISKHRSNFSLTEIKCDVKLNSEFYSGTQNETTQNLSPIMPSQNKTQGEVITSPTQSLCRICIALIKTIDFRAHHIKGYINFITI